MDKKIVVLNIIKEHICEIIKILEKQRYTSCNITLKNADTSKDNLSYNLKVKTNIFHENYIAIFNKHLEVLLNYMHHMINTNKDDSLNEVFNEIRMNVFIHNSCLIQKYVDIFKIIYENITIDELDFSNLDNYLDSIVCQSELIFKIFKNDILKNLSECTPDCKMLYDPQINPIKIN
jgi:hypothetical protein